MATVKSNMIYVLTDEGKDFPDWLINETSLGRAKVKRDEETNEIEGMTIISGTKTYLANVGDLIMKTKSGIVVVPKSEAKKYDLAKQEPKRET